MSGEKGKGEDSTSSHYHFVPWEKKCTYKIQEKMKTSLFATERKRHTKNKKGKGEDSTNSLYHLVPWEKRSTYKIQ